MSTERVTITGSRSLEKKLSAFAGKLSHPKIPLKESGTMLVKNFVKNFKAVGKIVNKTQWQALKPATIAEKIKLGYGSKGILVRTGKLRDSIKITQLNKFLVKVSSNLDYYKKHQLGDKNRNLPQRKMVDMTKQLSSDVMEILRTYFLAPFK